MESQLTREVTYRWRDPAYGERRERLLVVPRVDVRLDRSMLVWPLESRDPRTVTVTLSHAASDTTSGAVQLEVPAGWAAPPAQPFRLTRKGEEASFRFRAVAAGLARRRLVRDAGHRGRRPMACATTRRARSSRIRTSPAGR